MDAWRPKKTFREIVKEILGYIAVAAMWTGMLMMMVVLA